MFEPFSRGYYLGRLYVRPRDGERAVIHEDDHDAVRDQLYEEEVPVVMKLDGSHFQVHGAADVPGATLELPAELLDRTRVDHPPTLRGVFLARSDRADQLLQFAHGSS